MWIVFIHLKQKYIMEFSGDETMKDVKDIFCQVYGYSDKITFSNNEHSINAKSFEKPLKEFFESNEDYFEINIAEPDGSLNEKIRHTGPVKLNKTLSIGDQDEASDKLSERSSSSSRRKSLSSPSSENKKSSEKK